MENRHGSPRSCGCPSRRPGPDRRACLLIIPSRDGGWSAWFDGLQITSDDHGQTTITGPVADQVAPPGLLAKVRDLGLELLEVHRTDPD